MKMFKTEEFVRMEIAESNEVHRSDILTEEDKAKDLFGIFVVAPPGHKGQDHIHYHKKRESIFIIISGEGTAFVEGKEVPFKSGDVFFIPPNVVHTISNESDKDLRFLEFCTHPPLKSDLHKVS